MPELYIKYYGDTPIAYRYGDEIEATKLWVDGGYPTPEAAKEAWLRSQSSDQTGKEGCITNERSQKRVHRGSARKEADCKRAASEASG